MHAEDTIWLDFRPLNLFLHLDVIISVPQLGNLFVSHNCAPSDLCGGSLMASLWNFAVPKRRDCLLRQTKPRPAMYRKRNAKVHLRFNDACNAVPY